MPQRGCRAFPSLVAWRRVLPLALVLVGSQAHGDTLSNAFRRAQELVRDMRRSGERPPPSGETWGDGERYYNQAERAAEAARERLAEVERQLSHLEPATRAYLEQLTSAEERQTLEGLLNAVARLHREAFAQQEALERRLRELRVQLDALRARLRELDLEAEALGLEAETLQADLATLQAAAEQVRERVASLKKVLEGVTELDESLARESSAARNQYWQSVGDLFERLGVGGPRDFTSPVEAAPATTQRRVRRSSTGPTLIPPLVMPVSPAAPIPLAPSALAVPLPAAAAAAAPAATPSFEQTVDAWLSSASELQRAQHHVEGLLQAVETTEQAVHQRLDAIAAARPAVAQARSEVEEARHTFAQRALELESLHVRLSERTASALRSLGESLHWATAQEALSKVLSSAEAHAALAAHFTWVMRSYTTLLRDELPSAVELLGPNPSEAALEKFDRLTHLTERFIADRELGLMVAQLTSGSERPARATARAAAASPEARAVYQRLVDDLKEIVRQKKLAFNPATGKLRPDEMRGALRAERILGTLVRSEREGEDYYLQAAPRFTVDILNGNLDARYSLTNLDSRLRHHLYIKQGIDHVCINVETPEALGQLDPIRELVSRLPPEDQQRVLILTP